jgi:hypothetical protein
MVSILGYQQVIVLVSLTFSYSTGVQVPFEPLTLEAVGPRKKLLNGPLRVVRSH